MNTGHPKRVLCFGDSNTHGTVPLTKFGDWARYDASTRWPCIAQEKLGDACVLVEEGLPGRTTVHDDPIEGAHRNGASVLPALLETHRPLDGVVVMLGTNDCKPRFAVGPDDIVRSIARLTDMIRCSGCGPVGKAPNILIVAPVPLAETGVLAGIFEGGAAKSTAIAPGLRAFAEAEQVAFVDAGTVATVSDIDGVHLTPDGQRAVGQLLAEHIRGLL